MKYRLCLLLGFTISCLAGCALLSGPPSKPISAQTRLDVFTTLPKPPFEKDLTIYWNHHQVPFIEAASDHDAAFALGLVHAHLRLGQMQLAKRVAYGRLSEMLGPYFNDIDAALRTLNFHYSAKKTLSLMPEHSKHWLEAYVAGINHYQNHLNERPHEYDVLGLVDEPWTEEDTVTVGRLTGVDINWAQYFKLLPMYDTDMWDEIWSLQKTLMNHGEPSFYQNGDVYRQPSLDKQKLYKSLEHWLMAISRSGSNSVVIGPKKTTHGHALIANDPHLGINLPNFWIIAGLKSPSYHMVGMMVPGTPVFGFGRTPDLAWGGTNMRAWHSDLVELPKGAESTTTEKRQSIKTRWWFDDAANIRGSEYGPIVSDLEVLPPIKDKTLALRWIGHLASDEITALLDASKAKSGEEFRQALASFAIPGQNFLYADNDGNIGHVLATWVPNRAPGFPNDIMTTAQESDIAWEKILNATELPFLTNPKAQFIASANNMPTSQSTVPLVWHIPSDQRIRHLKHLLSLDDAWTVKKLMDLQQDTYSPDSDAFRHQLIKLARYFDWSAEYDDLLRTLESWNGRYDKASEGALVLQLVLDNLTPSVFEAMGKSHLSSLYQRDGQVILITNALMQTLEDQTLSYILSQALKQVSKQYQPGMVWGDIQKFELKHYFGNVPYLGGDYIFDEVAYGGSKETIFKAAHDITSSPHSVYYGSQSRHISDMGDINANHFVLLGGQDGWFGSENFSDQFELWQQGQFIDIPLEPKKVAESFPIQMTFAGKDYINQ